MRLMEKYYQLLNPIITLNWAAAPLLAGGGAAGGGMIASSALMSGAAIGSAITPAFTGLAASGSLLGGSALAGGAAAGGLWGSGTLGSFLTSKGASLAMSGASTLMQAKLAGDSADAQAAGLQRKALMEGLQAEEQSILRRERLIKALSAQGAQAGASGVRGGSVEALKETSITEFKREQKSADLMASINQSASQRAASSVKKGGKYQAAGTLLSYGQRLAEIG